MTATSVRTVRTAGLDVLRRLGATRWYGNPGSTEIPLLADLPEDFTYVLALHEGAAVAMATGEALATDRPVVVSLHTTAGLGNGVSAIATARMNRAPLVVLVGQQDRRHLASEPFLTGRLRGLAGDYPVQVFEPATAQAVPTVLAQAYWTAAVRRGPVLVIVPMDDWDCDVADVDVAAPLWLERPPVAVGGLAAAARELDSARSPVIVSGSGADTAEAWAAVGRLAERLDCAVWQEPFPSRPGFRQDGPRFAGILAAGRAELREQLAGHDLVLVVGTAMLRQYHYESGPFVAAGTRVVVLTDDPDEATRSTCDLAVVAPIAPACAQLAGSITQRRGTPRVSADTERARLRATGTSALTPSDVFTALAVRLPETATVVEETPSSREVLQYLLPARRNLGLLSAAMGGLGFALPAAVGIRLADPSRPVVAVVGDGSATYCIQALWSAVHYRVGVLAVVLDNANYGVMNRLTRRRGAVPWPAFAELRLDTVAEGFGARAIRVRTRVDLEQRLDELVPVLAHSTEPVVLVAEVPDESTEPVAR